MDFDLVDVRERRGGMVSCYEVMHTFVTNGKENQSDIYFRLKNVS